LGKTASEMRNKLGESLSTLRQFDTPLEQATTGSLEALQAYSLGRKAMAASDQAAAVPFFQRAIQLDPKFAMAYARLGMSYRNLGETTLGSANSRKAYELRDPVSELERFYIESHYYQNAVGNLGRAAQVYELWTQRYPRDWIPRINLSDDVYRGLGEHERALEEALATVRLNPSPEGYANLVYSYLCLNRLNDAGLAAGEAQTKKFDSPDLRLSLYRVAFLQNDVAGMAQQVVWARGKPGVENALLDLEANRAAYSGKLGKARELSGRAAASAEHAEEREVAARYKAGSALREGLFGNSAEAGDRAAEALDSSSGEHVQFLAALAQSFAGNLAQGEALAHDLGKRFPESMVVQSYYLPTIRAQLALSRKAPSRAIEVLQTAAPFELSSSGVLYPVYVRGEAYLAEDRGPEAAAEFQKLIDHRGIVGGDPIGALAHLQLGRAYALSRDKTLARSAYQDFLTLWKDADPDIPVLKQAKMEYASLK
jgi:hypothetical protein